jgi:hypothetical protein
LRFAGDAWFFQEGDRERFADARFGELRLTDAATVLLDGKRRRLNGPGWRPGGNTASPD